MGRIIRLINPVIKIKVRNLYSKKFDPKDYEPLKKGTIFYVVDKTRPCKVCKPGEYVIVPEIPKKLEDRWCWQFKVGNNGRLEPIPAWNAKYNNVYCSGWIWSGSKYDVYIKDYYSYIYNWKDMCDQERVDKKKLEEQLIRDTLVHPIEWKEKIKEEKKDSFKEIYVKGVRGEVLYLAPQMPREIWNIKITGFERWQPDPVFLINTHLGGLVKGAPIEHFNNYIQLNFDMEIDLYVDLDNKYEKYLVSHYAEIKKFILESRENIYRDYYNKNNKPYLSHKRILNGKMLEYTNSKSTRLDNLICRYHDTSNSEVKINSMEPYWRPNASSYFYELKEETKKGKKITYDLYWNHLPGKWPKDIVREKNIPIETLKKDYNFIEFFWRDFFRTGDDIALRGFWKGRNYEQNSIFLNNAIFQLPVKKDGSEIKLRFDSMFPQKDYFHENILKKYKDDKDRFVHISYRFTIKRTHKAK